MENFAELMKEMQESIMSRVEETISRQLSALTAERVMENPRRVATEEGVPGETPDLPQRTAQLPEGQFPNPRSVSNSRDSIGAHSTQLPAYQPITHYVVRPEVHSKITTFTGNGRHHPVLFLKELAQYFTVNGVPEGVRTSLAFGYMEGSALIWAEAFVDREAEFALFSQQFLETYWGASQQREVRFEIYQGSFKRCADWRMADHFAEMVGKAKHLRPTFSESELVEALTEHFPPEIANLLLAANLTAVGPMMAFLRKLDRNEERKAYARSEDWKSRPAPNAVSATNGRNPVNHAQSSQGSQNTWRERCTAENRNQARINGSRRCVNCLHVERDEREDLEHEGTAGPQRTREGSAAGK